MKIRVCVQKSNYFGIEIHPGDRFGKDRRGYWVWRGSIRNGQFMTYRKPLAKGTQWGYGPEAPYSELTKALWENMRPYLESRYKLTRAKAREVEAPKQLGLRKTGAYMEKARGTQRIKETPINAVPGYKLLRTEKEEREAKAI